MVKSVLDDSITYSENTNIDEGDIGYDAIQFEVELFPEIEANIALGNIRYTFADKGILFIPVYLVKNNEILEQIGVYEFLASRYTELLDEDDDFDITLLDNPLPLFYSFVNKDYLIKILGKKILKTKPKESVQEVIQEEEKVESAIEEKEEKDEEEKSPIEQLEELGDEELKTDEWSSPNKPTVLSEILKEDDDNDDDIDTNMQDAIDERMEYKPKRNDPWIKKFMKSSKYNLVDNEGKGDCLFAVIRDAYKGTKDITVEQLRGIVSENATQEVFDNFKERYDLFANEIRATRETQITLKGEYDDKLRTFKASQDRNEKKQIAIELKEIKSKFDTAKREYKYAQENVKDFLWMKGINTLDDFKGILKTCKFWAEQWAINVLEVMLNIKLIILSKQNYEVGDNGNVLSCGDLIDSSIEQKGEFKPKYYIIASYTGNHYMLVTYKSKRIFDFGSLPFAIKELVITKCMEGETGVYALIPKFKKLKGFIDGNNENREQKTMMSIESKRNELPRTDSGAEDMGEPKEERYDEGFENHKDVSFNDNIVFQFYSKSRDMKPGKGAGEKISVEDMSKFSELAEMKNWRKVLSNFYEGEFKLDGLRWLSVEHFYHASKFKKSEPNFYKLFSLDSKSDISKLPAMAKGAGGKTGKFKGKQIRPKKITMDDDFFSSKENEKAMYRGQMAKYKQNKEANDVLMATKDAKLQHFLRGQKPIVFYDTMKIREVLSNQ
jgi:predicted NAD-dependent protein-ADP-ribosyltransferase YbiA (DUF1768 family)